METKELAQQNMKKKDMYGELMNTDSDEEKNINYNVALSAQDSVSLEMKPRRVNRDIPSENVHNISQRHNEINETNREMVINKETNTVQQQVTTKKTSRGKCEPWRCQ